MLWRWPTLFGCLLLLLIAAPVQALPELPRVVVDTAPVAPTGRTIPVSAGGDFQGALNSAQPGDVIVLEAGASFTGSFTLPNKSGSGWITITGSRQASLPPQGTRVTPADAANMPKIVTTTPDPALKTASGAHHYRFRGVEIAASSSLCYVIVKLDGSALDASATNPYPAMTSLTQVPHHLIFEQVYLHGTPGNADIVRGFLFNTAHTALIDSHVDEIHSQSDSQAVEGWNGPGPFKIVNNKLVAAGENVMFGGAYAAIANLTPSDIEIRRNHITKELKWKPNDSTWDGSRWGIKNLLELKHAQRVLIDGNLFEYHWASAQSGFSLVITPRNEMNGGVFAMPWSIVANVTITNNVFRGMTAGINIYGRDDQPVIPGSGFLVKNNLFYDLASTTSSRWFVSGAYNGAFMLIANGASDVVVTKNTYAGDGGSVIITDKPSLPNPGLVLTDNIVPAGWYAFVGPGTIGGAVIPQMFPGAVVSKNALTGPWPTPGGMQQSQVDGTVPGNYYPASMAAVGFVSPSEGNFRLSSSSVYRNRATDGTDVGVNMDTLSAAFGTSTFTPPATPSTTTAATTTPTTSSTPPTTTATNTTPTASTPTTPTSTTPTTTPTSTTPTTTTRPATTTTTSATSPSSTSTTGTTAASVSTPASTTTSGPTGTQTASSPTSTATPPASAPTTSVAPSTTTVSALSTSATSTGGLSITSPLGTAPVTGTVQITAVTPLAPSITRIDYVLDGSLIAVTNPALFSLRWDSTQYPDGRHTLQVKAYDAGGVVGESSVTFTTQNNTSRPYIDLRAVLLNRVVKVIAYAKGQFPLTSIKLYGNGGLLTTVPCTNRGCVGAYTVQTRNVPPGTHTVSAVVTDERGVTSTRTVQVTVPPRQ